MRSDAQHRLLIRADGSKSVGMGHLSRACLVAKAFSARGYDVRLVVKENNDAKKFLQLRSIAPFFLADDISLRAEFDLIRNWLAEPHGLLILDVLDYRSYSKLFDDLRRKCCTSAVIFDDEGVECINADIALNGSLLHSGRDFSHCSCRYLVGPKYFIMDPSYRKVRVASPKKVVRDVFVTVGGSDHNDLLFKLLRAFDRFGDKYRLRIVSSAATGYSRRLSDELRKVKFPVELDLDPPSLVKFWGVSDVAITAGGNTLFERIATRLPGATLCQIDLQMKHAESFERVGVNVNFGFGPNLHHDDLFAKLKLFLNNHAEHERQHTLSVDLIDGDALSYFVAAIETCH